MEVIRLDGDPDARVTVTEEELEQWIQKQRAEHVEALGQSPEKQGRGNE